MFVFAELHVTLHDLEAKFLWATKIGKSEISESLSLLFQRNEMADYLSFYR